MGKSKNGEKYLKIGGKWEKFQNKKHCKNYRKIEYGEKVLMIQKLKKNQK